MSKNKNEKKSLRRQKEIIKAQISSGTRVKVNDSSSSVEVQEVAGQPKKLDQRLPFEQIKGDLLKTAIFAVIVIGFLIFLKTQNLEFDFGVNK